MLLDEPSTYLDLKSQIEMCVLLKRLAAEQHIGVLMASHDINLAAAFADRVLLLKDGSVFKDATPQVALQPDILRDVYQLEMERIDLPSGRPIIYHA
jgi:iron complex transport system ATP-binding protein